MDFLERPLLGASSNMVLARSFAITPWWTLMYTAELTPAFSLPNHIQNSRVLFGRFGFPLRSCKRPESHCEPLAVEWFKTSGRVKRSRPSDEETYLFFMLAAWRAAMSLESLYHRSMSRNIQPVKMQSLWKLWKSVNTYYGMYSFLVLIHRPIKKRHVRER